MRLFLLNAHKLQVEGAHICHTISIIVYSRIRVRTIAKYWRRDHIYIRTRDRSQRVVPRSTRGEPPPSARGRALELGYTHKSRPHAYSQLKGVTHSHDGSGSAGNFTHSAVGEEIAHASEGIAQRCLLIYLGRTLMFLRLRL